MVYRYIIRIRRFEQVSNSIDRSQILSQLKVILSPQEYKVCEGLSDAELSAKLREALSNNSNMGVGDKFEFSTNTTPEIFTKQQPQKPIIPTFSVESQIPQLSTEQAQDIAMANLWAINSDIASAQRELDTEKMDDNVIELMSAEARGLYYLDKARSQQGLTKKEYREGIKNDLKMMLLGAFPNLDGKKINLDERLDSLDNEQIKMMQKAILTANSGKVAKNEVLRTFADATQIVETITSTTDGQTHTETRTKVKPPSSQQNESEELISFEELYKIERRTDFNPENIRQYLIDGTVTYFQDPFENGIPSMEDLEKHTEYTQRLPKSYISAFGQPYRSEYLSILKNSDYESSPAYGVTTVKLDDQLQPSEEGSEYIIPTKDLTQARNSRELEPAELKRFSANMLYNILSTTHTMLKGYYDGAWEQLKSGSVGTAAVQGFLSFGEMLSGQDLTVRSQMDKVEALLAKAAELKNMDDNAFEQHFDEFFKEIAGTSFDPAAMQNFAQLTMKGVKTDSDEYNEAVTRAFGSNRTGDTESQFSVLTPFNTVVDVVSFLAGSEVIGGTKLFAKLGAKSLRFATNTATKLGFNPANKAVQTGIKLASGSQVSSANLVAYNLLTEIPGTIAANVTGHGLTQEQAEFVSVMEKHPAMDDDLTRILKDCIKQGAMGATAPFIGAVANKTGTKIATLFSKGNPTAIQKTFSTLAKAENKTQNAQTFMTNYFTALDTPALTKIQEVIKTTSALLTEVAGFTGYSTLEHIAEGILTGELDIDSLDLGEEFKGQLQGIVTLKGIARFIQMKKSGAIARDVQDKIINDLTKELKDYTIKEVDGKFEITSKDGKTQKFNSPDELISFATRIMFGHTPKAIGKKANFNQGTPDITAKDPTKRPHGKEAKKAEPKDPFNLKGQFDESTLNLTGNDILKKIGVDKEGNDIMQVSEEYEDLIMNISKQIREIALTKEGGPKKINDKDDPNYDYTQDKGIVGIMHRLGFTQNAKFYHRSKSEQSLHDKIQNALIGDREMKLSELVTKEVRDAVGVRSVREKVDLKNDPEIQALIKAGDKKSALDLAIEKESAHVYKSLMDYIDSVANGTNEIEITSISNYMGEDGIPYFTERQLFNLKAYAAIKKVNLPIIERVTNYDERDEKDDVFRKKATTKVRGSGYTALQMNFRTKDGFVYEWQYRGGNVNNFAEGEHIPYDLRTNKDIVGKNTELHDLFDPIKKLLDKDTMSEPQFEEYNNYLTAHYEYLRLTELGIEDGSNPPKLPKGFDPRLRAENLELLHEKAEETKKHPKEKDRIFREYTEEIENRERTNPNNYTTKSYTKEAAKKKATRVMSEDEAEVRLGKNIPGSNEQDITEIVAACKNESGAIYERYIIEAEKMLRAGITKDNILARLKEIKITPE